MDALTIERLDRGYVVEIERCGGITGDLDLKRLACADRLDVVREVLTWLGWDVEAVAEAADVLDDIHYVLTDKGRAALDALRPDERAKYNVAEQQAAEIIADDAERQAAIRRTAEEQAGTRRTAEEQAMPEKQRVALGLARTRQRHDEDFAW